IVGTIHTNEMPLRRRPRRGSDVTYVGPNFSSGNNAAAFRSLRMSPILFSILLTSSLTAAPPPPDPPSSLRGVLLEQLKTTHNNKDWFATASSAVDGLTPEQASWRVGKVNHSIGQLVNHLVFWNRQ